MKKLIFTMSCITAIALMSSCTTDSIEEPTNSINNNIQETPTPTPTPVYLENGDDNKDKVKT
jgi:hypothetical protein